MTLPDGIPRPAVIVLANVRSMDDETREALAVIVARIDSITAPPMSAADQVQVIEAEAEATVAVIEATADAQVTVTEATTEQTVELVETEAKVDGPLGERDELRPEADHWYFKSLGAR